MLGIIAMDAIGKPDVGSALLGSASKHMDLIASAVKSGAIVYPFGPDLPSAFLVLTGVVAVSVLIAVIAIPIYVLTILLAIPIGFISSSAEAVRKAEESKRRTIDDPRQVDQLARTLAHESRSIFAPRLVVLTVAASAWRYTVASLAAVSSAILIDISEPTENLLWEISELREQFGSRFLVVGEYDRLLQLESLATSAPESISARLVALLDGQQVLAYSADGRGMRRFGRALRDRLETLPTQAVS
jgi:hypothetical protein